MGTVSSSTTDEELKGLYLDNCTWYEDQDPVKARAFVSVLQALLFRGVRTLDVDGARIEMEPRRLEQQMKEAQRFADSFNQRTSQIKHPILTCYRD